MNQHNPFAHFIERERAAGHRPRLPENLGERSRVSFRDETLAGFRAHGPATIKQVAAAMGQDTERVRHACKKLVQLGKIKSVGKVSFDMIWESVA